MLKGNRALILMDNFYFQLCVPCTVILVRLFIWIPPATGNSSDFFNHLVSVHNLMLHFTLLILKIISNCIKELNNGYCESVFISLSSEANLTNYFIRKIMSSHPPLSSRFLNNETRLSEVPINILFWFYNNLSFVSRCSTKLTSYASKQSWNVSWGFSFNAQFCVKGTVSCKLLLS